MDQDLRIEVTNTQEASEVERDLGLRSQRDQEFSAVGRVEGQVKGTGIITPTSYMTGVWVKRAGALISVTGPLLEGLRLEVPQS